jgi:hypothetical protein
MAERKPAKTGTQQSVKSTTGEASKGFTDEERAAMRERAHEVKAAARRDSRAGKTDGEATCSRRSPRCRGTRRSASATRRTSTLRAMWPTSFALKELTAAEEARIGALVKKAVS